MEVLIDGIELSKNFVLCSSCGYYSEYPDGSCAVDLSDGCDCDTYMGSGLI